MKRTKRFTIRRIALGLAVAAFVPASAQAATAEIPYLSQGVGVSAQDLGVASSKHPDDRAFSRQSRPDDFWNYDAQTGAKIANSSPGVKADELAQVWGASQEQPSVEIPYLSQGVGVSPVELGIAGSPHSDDRTFSRATSVDSTPSATGSSGYDLNTGLVSGFALALVLAVAGSAVALRHSRKTKLSPA